MKQWYESLFENYGRKYDNENFTQGTIGECDFIEKEIDFNKSLKIIANTNRIKTLIKSCLLLLVFFPFIYTFLILLEKYYLC
ncbi:unnamed protein product [marine sediment metagenome]|uniref:Uncharacterized protein n=1 Tax=marine sediment metagenome TaxID=412755 RepID=X1FIP3_9ZZZZ